MAIEHEEMFASICRSDLQPVSCSPNLWSEVVTRTIAKIVVHPKTLPSVPTAECILSHLPSDRLPTIEELRAAWRACAT